MLLPILAMGEGLKYSGLVFGDYYHFTSAKETYMTFNSEISEEFSARLRGYWWDRKRMGHVFLAYKRYIKIYAVL